MTVKLLNTKELHILKHPNNTLIKHVNYNNI